MTKKSNKIKAFSLAEALITLLIVSMITIAAVPVLTKKRTEKENHGKWICTRNAAGQHIQWTTSAVGDAFVPQNPTVTGDSCSFTPPPMARNFNITAVGGGGGGGGGLSENKSWNSDFKVEHAGKYKAVAIGGGGGGGKSNKDEPDHRSQNKMANGGGAGGVGYVEFELDENATQVTFVIGKTNAVSHSNKNKRSYDGKDGTATVITSHYQNSSGNTESKIILKAEGGQGGRGRKAGTHSTDTDMGEQGIVSSDIREFKTFNTSKGKGQIRCSKIHCCGITPLSTQRQVNNLIKPHAIFAVNNPNGGNHPEYYVKQVGRGGDTDPADDGNFGRDGVDGAAIVTTQIFKSGEGGKASEPAEKFVPSFKERKIKVTVGAAGKGGVNGADGGPGGDTEVENYVFSSGAQGGKSNNLEKASIDTPGEDGEKTRLFYKSEPAPGYGGLSGPNKDVNGLTSDGYGAGGGGGGANADKGAGNGGDGSPGYVLIEW